MTALRVAVTAVFLIPSSRARYLRALPGYKLTSRLNVAAALLTFLASLSLFFLPRPAAGNYLFVDDLNVVFIVLNTFVGFTTSIFSATYIAPRTRDRPADAQPICASTTPCTR